MRKQYTTTIVSLWSGFSYFPLCLTFELNNTQNEFLKKDTYLTLFSFFCSTYHSTLQKFKLCIAAHCLTTYNNLLLNICFLMLSRHRFIVKHQWIMLQKCALPPSLLLSMYLSLTPTGRHIITTSCHVHFSSLQAYSTQGTSSVTSAFK